MPLAKSDLFREQAHHWTVAMGSPSQVDPLEAAVARGKLQILDDVRRGNVPMSIASFADLHDYVDANGYGDAFDWPVLPSELDDDAYGDAFTSFWNRVQDRLEQWIQSGRLRAEAQSESWD